jgi:hypothetical protein
MDEIMINVKEINCYNPAQWQQYFSCDPYYQNIAQNYQTIIYSHKEMTILKASLHCTVYQIPREFLKMYHILDATPYYYINFLLERSTDSIVDIGCGVNYFKPHLPNLIGIDANPDANFDLFDHFDEDFANGHTQSYDSLISINTIHFKPINQITKQLLLIAKLIKPGGRGFVSFNLETWLMYSDIDLIHSLFGQCPQFDDIVNYVDTQILQTNLDFIVVDWPVLHITHNSSIRDELNGNIRLVFNV